MKIYFKAGYRAKRKSLVLIEADGIEIQTNLREWDFALDQELRYSVYAWQSGERIEITGKRINVDPERVKKLQGIIDAIAVNPGREIDFIWIEFPDNVYVRFLDDDK